MASAVIDRSSFLVALADEEPWASHRIDDPVALQITEDSAALIYQVVARRDGQPEYTTLIASVYVKREDRWKLVLHQQTPMRSAQ